MDFRKIYVALMLCAFSVAAPRAAAQWRLPQIHNAIAENQINLKSKTAAPFVAAAQTEVRSNSPFSSIVFPMMPKLTVDPLATRLVDYASKFVGTRYRSGASGPKAFDCSGFTSYVFKNFGISLNRTSSSQFEQGEKVSIGNLQPGDLMFFSSHGSGRGRVGHVAMVVAVDQESGKCTFIHASSKRGVVYQNFPDGGYYQKNFLGARRVLPNADGASENLASK